MHARLLCHLLCAVVLLAAFAENSGAQGKKAKAPGQIEAYSASVTALNGPSGTDVSVILHTNDAGNSPVPEFLKKLQIKVLTDSGDVAYIKNFFDVPVTDGRVSMSIEDIQPLMTVLVQAHVQTAGTVDEEVLPAKGIVLLRPDLVVASVNHPAQVRAGAFFDVETVIREENHHTGAIARVSLYEGETLLATATGIEVLPGDQVSVLFQGLQLAGTGIHDLIARIHDAVPGEYDTGNNEAAFSVEVLNPMVAVWYSMSYSARKNHVYYYSTYSSCGGYSTTTEYNNYDELQYTASLAPASFSGVSHRQHVASNSVRERNCRERHGESVDAIFF